ncbi:Hypothetical protein GSB_150035, partial [Giardia duodenalis]
VMENNSKLRMYDSWFLKVGDAPIETHNVSDSSFALQQIDGLLKDRATAISQGYVNGTQKYNIFYHSAWDNNRRIVTGRSQDLSLGLCLIEDSSLHAIFLGLFAYPTLVSEATRQALLILDSYSSQL